MWKYLGHFTKFQKLSLQLYKLMHVNVSLYSIKLFLAVISIYEKLESRKEKENTYMDRDLE